MTTILLAEDHKILRQGLKLLLESEPGFSIVAETGNGDEAVELARQLQPDFLVTDLKMPGADGIKVPEQVSRVSPKTRVIILSMFGDMGYVVRALNAGVRGYVLKDSGAEDLVQAIKVAAGGEVFLSPPLSHETVERYRRTLEGDRRRPEPKGPPSGNIARHISRARSAPDPAQFYRTASQPDRPGSPRGFPT